LFFRNIPETSIFARLRRAVSLEAVSASQTREIIYDVAADMIYEAEKNALHGDLWELFFAQTLVEDENPICRAYERQPVFQRSILEIVSNDIWNQHKIITAVKAIVQNDVSYSDLRPLSDFVPLRGADSPLKQVSGDVMRLAANIAISATPEDMLKAVKEFYAIHGSGRFAINYAFRWDSARKDLIAIGDIDRRTLGSLVGYESQKAELLGNTESFLSGKPANNVLLFGDSGTGKSSSVRALLNEPDFVRRGLRMIELRQDQFPDIPSLLNEIRGRNYRFILFMDDLSFEEFEVEYKYLKALIEGGLERKPDNAVIYATSNRRNIIREVWADRASSTEDVHGWDTMQEKHSLSDRFGLTIWYPSVGKDDYLSIVRSIAEEMKLPADYKELEHKAMRWELEKGGFTGRTARQFVQHMMSSEE
jgi:predicted AAA+ superfamily ATPase